MGFSWDPMTMETISDKNAGSTHGKNVNWSPFRQPLAAPNELLPCPLLGYPTRAKKQMGSWKGTQFCTKGFPDTSSKSQTLNDLVKMGFPSSGMAQKNRLLDDSNYWMIPKTETDIGCGCRLVEAVRIPMLMSYTCDHHQSICK